MKKRFLLKKKIYELDEGCEKNLKKEENALFTPFSSDFIPSTPNFNKEKIKEKLLDLLPEKDHKFISHIINDKKYYFPDNLTIERGVFRDNNGNLLGLVVGDKKGFTLPSDIMSTGINHGFGIMSHNHVNGLVIPSKKDISTMILLQSYYSPIYSPDKSGLLVNNNVIENKKNWELISNKYIKFHEKIESKIERMNYKKTKKIRNTFKKNLLEEKLGDLYRPYYVKNQYKIIGEINTLFRDNSFDLKFYIL